MEWAWLSLALAGFLFAVPASPAFAQGEKQEAAAEDSEAGEEKAEKAPLGVTNMLSYIWEASPLFFLIMSLMSFYLVYIIADCFLKIRAVELMPPPLLATVDGMLNDKKYKEAYEVVKSSKSLLGRALTVGVERLSHGFERAEEAMLAVTDDGKMEMEHRLGPVATIGSVAPMLGLLGTVLGMVFSFDEISRGGQPQPAELAKGIGLALVTTLEGLVVALPAVGFYGYYRNYVARLTFDTQAIGETYLWRFAAALKK